jgi:ankyrin repeat protein
LQKVALVDAQDANGNTPLWRAVFAHQGNEELIALLLENGANPERANRDGVTPLSLAEAVADPEVRHLFESDVVFVPAARNGVNGHKRNGKG